ncbi:MAG: NrsF family protein [Gammaproteobacteria bacterium]
MSPGAIDSTERVVLHLVSGLEAVRRLPSPGSRAVRWLAMFALTGVAFVMVVTGTDTFLATTRDGRALAEWIAMLATGVIGVHAAFHTSIPGYRQVWAWAAWIPALAWLLLASLGCFHRADAIRWTDGSDMWHYLECFGWVVGCGVPLSMALFGSLRTAAPLWPATTAVQACLGAAGLTAALMGFFHPTDPTFIDLASHFAALALVVGCGAIRARAALLP